jgi:hypothetical protein
MINTEKYIKSIVCFLLIAFAATAQAQTHPQKEEKKDPKINDQQVTYQREFPSKRDSMKYPKDSITFPEGYYRVPKDASGKDSNMIGSMPR